MLPGKDFATVKAMNPAERLNYFMENARYNARMPKPYSIRVGAKFFHDTDTMGLREQFDKHMRYKSSLVAS